MYKKVLLILSVFVVSYGPSALCALKMPIYPSFACRKCASANTTYYIDPVTGNDQNSGISVHKPWKTFIPANKLRFTAGDMILVLRPGEFRQSLVMVANGSRDLPVTIAFAPGRYEFFPDSAYKTRLNITNTNDAPDSLKRIALYFLHSKHVYVQADGAKIILRGKMIETCVDSCENITIRGISFDYQRPTVSELTVKQTRGHYADLQIHPDSKYLIQDSTLTWVGEGWRYQPGWYWQVFDPATGNVSRQSIDLGKVKFVNDSGFVKALFAKNPGFKTGFIYQNRDVLRDCAGIFMRRSKNISLQNIRIYFMHGMGVVSQFCENIKIDSLVVRPDKKSGRTCAAWADILHFSNCRGLINVDHCFLSASNDDAINVHGAYLKIIEKLSPNIIRVKFMHNQTFGFDAFAAGDHVDLIDAESLLPIGSNTVTAAQRVNAKEIVLTLKNAIPANIPGNVVIENTTWTPRVWIHNCTLSNIPTRGILITTRGGAVIENCTFRHINMSGVLVEDDANSWYESGMVRNLIIRRNTFQECGGPVIKIHPENKIFKGAVHKNIAVTDNLFILKDTNVLEATSVAGITFSGNKIITKKAMKLNDLIKLKDCSMASVSANKMVFKQ